MHTAGDVGMNKDRFTSKYTMVDKARTSNFSNTVKEGNGLLPLFSNSRRITIYPSHTKKGLSHLVAIKQGTSMKKMVKKMVCINSHNCINPLPLLFKSPLPGQEDCVFSSGHLN
jgi:hypothetical protein